jgi:hypothetical protein
LDNIMASQRHDAAYMTGPMPEQCNILSWSGPGVSGLRESFFQPGQLHIQQDRKSRIKQTQYGSFLSEWHGHDTLFFLGPLRLVSPSYICIWNLKWVRLEWPQNCPRGQRAREL